jgi:hypothetical protein
VVQDSVLSVVGSPDLAVYVVWEPIFRTDDERAARRATVLFPDDRVKKYWAPTQDVGALFQPAIGLEKEVAWDVYLVYRPGRVWEGTTPPVPDDFMHQLWARLPAEKMLDGGKLRMLLQPAADD